MSPLPDPEALEAVAARIAAHARAARTRAHRLATAVGGTDWSGVASGAFDLMAEDVIGGLRRSADRLDDAADALRRHAAAVRQVLDCLRRAAVDGVHAGTDLVHGMLDEAVHPGRLPGDAVALLDDTGHLADDAAHLVGHLLGIG